MSLVKSAVDSDVERERRPIVFLFPIATVLCMLAVKLRFQDIYSELIQEDSVIEYLQFVFYFMAACFALLVARSFHAGGRPFLASLYLLFSLVLLFVSLEEISWGQRA